MAENVLKLKKRAVALGMARATALKADRPALEAFISDAESGKSSKASSKSSGSKKAAKKSPAKAVAKKKKVAKKSGENTKAPAAKKSGTGSGKAKRPSRKAAPQKAQGKKRPARKAQAASDLGRNNIDALDFNVESDEWNPRKGGPVERLFKALKSSRGDIDKAFAKLEDDVWDFVGKKMRDGSKRSKASAHKMLRYRLNRTLWDYATRTGQHVASDSHVDYGTGVYARPKSQGGRKRSAAKRETERKPSRKKSASKAAASPKRKASKPTAKKSGKKSGKKAKR